MEIIPFNQYWTYKKIDGRSQNQPVNLPHDAMIVETRNQSNRSGIHACYFAGYDYQYTKRFIVEKSMMIKKSSLNLKVFIVTPKSFSMVKRLAIGHMAIQTSMLMRHRWCGITRKTR